MTNAHSRYTELSSQDTTSESFNPMPQTAMNTRLKQAHHTKLT